MKFSKVLNRLTSEVPELDEMFLSYKKLKKQLKTIPAHTDASQRTGETQQGGKVHFSTEEQAFINSLNQELDRFNNFFIQREEEAVIQLQVLTERLNQDRSPDVLASLVDFHGQAVLLLHWSLLNYAAVAKILKKHDKRTGVLLRAPYLASCLQQPFNSTALLSRLVKQAEALLQGKLTTTSNCPPQAPQTATQTESANQANEREGSAPAPAPPAAPNQDPTHVGIGDGGRLAGGGGQQTHAEAGAGGVVFVDVGTTSGAVSTVMSGVTSVVSGVASGISCVGEGHRLISDSALFRKTRLALETWNTLRSTAATPSTVLEPPPAGTRLATMQRANFTPTGSPCTSSRLGNAPSVESESLATWAVNNTNNTTNATNKGEQGTAAVPEQMAGAMGAAGAPETMAGGVVGDASTACADGSMTRKRKAEDVLVEQSLETAEKRVNSCGEAPLVAA